jgi:uncharacterized membrane protein
MSSRYRRWVVAGAVIAGLLSLTPRARAHAGHKHSPAPSPTATPEAPPSDTPPGDSGGASQQPEARSTPPPTIRVPLREAIFEHLHNKVVHFPLALGCAAALLILLGYRWPQYWPAAQLLLLLAAAAAVAAYFTGKAQAEDVENGPLRQYFELHESLGITSAVSLWLGWALTLAPRARPWLWLYALLLLALLSGTGFLGGILSHAAI